MGWIQFTRPFDAFVNTYRRMWVWDPTSEDYRVVEYLYRTTLPTRGPDSFGNAAFTALNTQINLLNNQNYTAYSRAWGSGLGVVLSAFAFREATENSQMILLSAGMICGLAALGRPAIMIMNNNSNYVWSALNALEAVSQNFLWNQEDVEMAGIAGCNV